MAALAWYGDKCTDGVRNVITIIQNPASKVCALNLTTPGLGEKLEAANNKDRCPTLFEPEGMAY